MANLITLSRLILLAAVVVVIYSAPPQWQAVSVLVLIATFVSDAVDGYVARKRKEASRFGAVFDIASDRIVEWTLWIVFVDLDLVPVWVLLLFVVRGIIVDAIRSSSELEAPFSMMRSAIGRWLVAGKFMRINYAVLKAVTFCWLLLELSLPAILPVLWEQWGGLFSSASGVLVAATVLACVARGLPVIAEFVYTERRSLLGSLSRDAREAQAG